jgi:hypothetical protein
MPRRLWIWLGILASGTALFAEGHAAGSPSSISSGRSTVKKSYCGAFIPFNNRRALFRGNASLRRAVNWALDRTDYVAGSDTLTPWTHLLPPNAPGSITKASLQPYGTRANIAKAREIAAGHFRDGRISVYYSSSGPTGPARAENVRRDLINLGFDPRNITMRGFAGFGLYDEIGKRNSTWDLAVSDAFCGKDPTAFMLPRWYFPRNPKYLRRVRAAMRLTGRARTKALGRLDLEIMRNVAPVAVVAFSDGS